MRETSQVERQLYMLSLLSQNRRGYTVDEIISRLSRLGIDVSRKTVERDIDFISMNFFVGEEERDGKIVYFAKKYDVENISFTMAELISLHFMRELISAYRGMDVADTARQLINRIITDTPTIDRAYIDTLKDMLRVEISGLRPEQILHPEYLETLQEAIAENKQVQIVYSAFASGERTARIFEPYLLEVYEGCWHLVGFCHLRHAVRTLRVSRMEQVDMLDATFKRPPNFYESYQQQRFDKLSGAEDEKELIRIRFVGDAARFIREYEKDKADRLTDKEDGLLFERSAVVTSEVIKWVLGFGAEAEVIAPEGLWKTIQDQAKKMGEIYTA